jgi:hypothetical protein
VKSIKPLIGIVEHLRREISWGMSVHRTAPISATLHGEELIALQAPLNLGHAVLDSVKTAESIVHALFPSSTFKSRTLESEVKLLSQVNRQLLNTRDAACIGLQKMCKNLELEHRGSKTAVGFRPSILSLCLFMVSVLQVRKVFIIMHSF